MEYDDYCSICGIALTKFEVAADIRGDFVMFIDKNIGTIQMTLCTDCANKIIEISLGGMDAAVRKRDLKNDSDEAHGRKFMRNKLRREGGRDEGDKGDDDDGGMPVPPP